MKKAAAEGDGAVANRLADVRLDEQERHRDGVEAERDGDAGATPSPFWPSANIQEARTIRAGFMNSDGCNENPPISTQRVAPLAWWPSSGSAIIIATATR